MSAPDLLKTIVAATERVTTFMIPVPTLFARFLDAPEIEATDLSSLRVVGYGAMVSFGHAMYIGVGAYAVGINVVLYAMTH